MLVGNLITEERHIVFEIDGERYALPAYAVNRVIRCEDLDWAEFAKDSIGIGVGGMCQVEGNQLPIVMMETIMRMHRRNTLIEMNERALLMVEVDNQPVGLMVDTCIGIKQWVTLYPLPQVFEKEHVFSMAYGQDTEIGLYLSWVKVSAACREKVVEYVRKNDEKLEAVTETFPVSFSQIFYEQENPHPVWAIKYMHTHKVTAELKVKNGDAIGYVAFKQGELIAACMGNLEGEQALDAILESGHIECSLQKVKTERERQELRPTAQLMERLAKYPRRNGCRNTVLS